MPSCEKCWRDSCGDALRYQELIEERDAAGIACSPEEQAGQWWDAEKQVDTRIRRVSSEP